MDDKLEGYITVSEAADRLERSSEQVRRYLREGKLEGRRLGGQWFIRESAVAYVTRREEAAEVSAKPWPVPVEYTVAMAAERRALFQRIRGRREEMRQRWERVGIQMDAADMVRELREEAP
ncbi:MAG: helix-turn-helix domain-containing protein [Chloroflexi bacterium]|nr:helix-turn-helix domain-containing protein [Chloroflexota bacterium]